MHHTEEAYKRFLQAFGIPLTNFGEIQLNGLRFEKYLQAIHRTDEEIDREFITKHYGKEAADIVEELL